MSLSALLPPSGSSKVDQSMVQGEKLWRESSKQGCNCFVSVTSRAPFVDYKMLAPLLFADLFTVNPKRTAMVSIDASGCEQWRLGRIIRIHRVYAVTFISLPASGFGVLRKFFTHCKIRRFGGLRNVKRKFSFSANTNVSRICLIL